MLLLWLACGTNPVSPAEGAGPEKIGANLDSFDCGAVAEADGFDYPVGPPHGRGYYNAQDFLVNTHLGEDWNGVGGGDSDLGDPIFVIGRGVVTEAREVGGGWGAVVRVAHRVNGRCLESLYAHFLDFSVAAGDVVRRGQLLGHMGTANGQYRAHLHLELRDRVGADLGHGYGVPENQLDPHIFIDGHRTLTAPSGR